MLLGGPAGLVTQRSLKQIIPNNIKLGSQTASTFNSPYALVFDAVLVDAGSVSVQMCVCVHLYLDVCESCHIFVMC